jgi:hypothetical protein
MSLPITNMFKPLIFCIFVAICIPGSRFCLSCTFNKLIIGISQHRVGSGIRKIRCYIKSLKSNIRCKMTVYQCVNSTLQEAREREREHRWNNSGLCFISAWSVGRFKLAKPLVIWNSKWYNLFGNNSCCNGKFSVEEKVRSKKDCISLW